MAAQVVTSWSPARAVAARDETNVSCAIDDAVDISPSRALAAAGLVLVVTLLVLAPALVALASMAEPSAMARVEAWTQGAPSAVTFLVSWRVPACIVLVLALARPRRQR